MEAIPAQKDNTLMDQWKKEHCNTCWYQSCGDCKKDPPSMYIALMSYYPRVQAVSKEWQSACSHYVDVERANDEVNF